MRRLIVALVLVASSSCASVPLKQRAVLSLQASANALDASHVAERQLCSPTADVTMPIARCDGAAAMTIGLTDARHLALARLYSRAFDAHDKAATALIAWRAGEPKPATLTEYQTAINDIIALLVQFMPSGQPTAEKVQDASEEAAIVAQTFGGQP